MSHQTYAEETEAELRAALDLYNRLYPDAPIRHLGDTPDRIFHLLDWTPWHDGKTPLHADAVAAIERKAEDMNGFSQRIVAARPAIKRFQVGGSSRP